MRLWDLSAPAAKLELALETLEAATVDVAQQWNDETFERFREAYLDPLKPSVRRALDGIQRLAEVVAKAQRECESY
jgi:hypothetical protein